MAPTSYTTGTTTDVITPTTASNLTYVTDVLWSSEKDYLTVRTTPTTSSRSQKWIDTNLGKKLILTEELENDVIEKLNKISAPGKKKTINDLLKAANIELKYKYKYKYEK